MSRHLTIPSPEEAAIATETMRAVEQALATLPKEQRAALLWRKVEGLSPHEIGARMGLSARQVQRLVSQAIEHCQAQLRDLDGDKA